MFQNLIEYMTRWLRRRKERKVVAERLAKINDPLDRQARYQWLLEKQIEKKREWGK